MWGWPSTVTPTGCSSWTTRRGRCRDRSLRPLLSVSVLRRRPGALALYNAACSRMVPEVIAEGGGRSMRTRVGHSLIKQVMAETGAAFAGEHSGHYYFAENYCSDSGVLAALVLLEELSRAGVALSEMRRPFGPVRRLGGDQLRGPRPAGGH